MQYTTNYSLKKPQYADEADIEVINDNTDDVDTLIHQNRTMIAPAFDNTKAYVTGDPVEYLGALYVFVADKAAGAWDASKVEPTTAAEMGGGGTSALADLDDVEITSPANKQTMKYNSTSQKWENGNSDLGDLGDVEITTPTEGQALIYNDDDDVWENQTLPDASVTKEATGNPIELTDAASAPLVKCTTTIQGYQEGTGTPSPDNVRPIHAYTESTISVGGRNLFDGTNLAYWINGTGTSAGRSTGDSGGIVDVSGYEKVTVSTTIAQARYRLGFISAPVAMNASTTVVSGVSLDTQSTSYTYTVPSNAKYLVINATDLKKIQVEKGTTATPYEPYTSTTHTTTFSQSVYQGNADFVGERVMSDYIFGDFANVDWTPSTPENHIFRGVLTSVVNASIELSVLTSLCNKYGAMAWADISASDNGKYSYAVPANRIVIIDHRFSTVSDFVSSLSDIQMLFKLVAPTTESITPTNLPIKSLAGYNHIESSTGDMEIEYITKTYEPLVELIQSSDHIYSTQEQVVGTWVDGKTLYEQTLTLPSAINLSAGAWTNSGCQISGIELIPKATVIRSDSKGPWTISVGYDTSTGDIQLYSNAAISLGAGSMIILQYTKSSSNRSLSAPVTSQKSISEPLTDKTEEVLTEEEKTVEKPETEEETNETER